jgi:hypothetical protein
MSIRKTLAREINRQIDALTAQGEPLEVECIVRAVCDTCKKRRRKEREAIFLYALQRLVRIEVANALTCRLAARLSTDAQLTLEGFDHIKAGYLVDRDGCCVAVPIDQIDVHELAEREGTLRKRAAALEAYADELARLIDKLEAAERAEGEEHRGDPWLRRADLYR